MPLSSLWVAMLTRDVEDAGTDNNKVLLSIQVDGVQLLNQRFFDSTQPDQKRGRANLYKFNVQTKGIEPRALTDSSVRLKIESDEAWNPEHFFAWGAVPPASTDQLAEIVPLVMETGITDTLSTDEDEGVRSIRLRRVAKGDNSMRIRRLLILLVTDSTSGKSSTGNALEIQIVSNDRLVALCEIKNTAQGDLDSGMANFYTMPVIFPFTKGSLNNQSITMRIKGGMDDWRPVHFFIFGLDDAAGRPESIVPLVHLPQWPFGLMTPDATNGIASITLPLEVENLLTGDFDPDGSVHTLRSIETGQQTTNLLLEQVLAKLA